MTQDTSSKMTVLCGRELMDLLKKEGLDTVAGAFAYSGGKDMTKPGLGHRERRNLYLTGGRGVVHKLFMKRYGREPPELVRRRLREHGPGMGPAAVELENVRALQAAGVPTISEAICGEEWDENGPVRGYVILSAVPGAALEQCAEAFFRRHASEPEIQGGFTAALAQLVRTLHGAGIVHRDLYASHVFLDEKEGGFDLYLIDLARVFRPRRRAARWFVKDLAQLKYSMPPAWTSRHWDKFLELYWGGNATWARSIAWKLRIGAKVFGIRLHSKLRKWRGGA